MNSITIEMPKLPAVSHNLEGIKSDLIELKNRYETAIYDDDTISIAKKERAMLNSVVKELDEKRKAVKNTYLEPYNAFEKEIKALEGIINPAISNIDSQVKAFEERQREEKTTEMQAHFNREIRELSQFVSLEKIMNEKWLNKGSSIESVKSEISLSIDAIKKELETLEIIGGENLLRLKAIYFRNLSLSDAISENAKLTKEMEKMKNAVECETPILTTEPVYKKVIQETPAEREKKLYNISFKASKKEFSEIQALLFSLRIEWMDEDALGY